MSEFFQRLSQNATKPEVTRPDPSKVILGNPVFTTWNVEERDGLFSGIWQSTLGKWRIAYAEWEYCRILSGTSILTGADGVAHIVKVGDSFLMRPGFEGTWEVVETTTKDYVIRM
jgi:uncharacterized protein